jgi:putative ABC transport system permease protein
MRGLRADARDAIRGLLGRPLFTIMLILTLGLGIGATTTVWSFAYALLLRPYPYQAPKALVRVQSVYTKEGSAKRGMSLPDLDDYRRYTTTLDAIGAYTLFDMRLLTDGAPVVVSTANVNPDTLSMLGVAPLMGRLLLPAEDQPGGDVNKAVISYDVWQTVFGGDPTVVGKPLRSDRHTYTIVGVTPQGFAFPDRVGVWMSMESWYSNLPPNDERRQKWRGARWYATVARLRPGTTLAAAQTELNAIAAQLERDYPRESDGVRVALTPLREFEMGAVRPYLLVCLAGVAFVLLICCANVANLLLVRATTRMREIAVKTALGASRWRIARGLIVENLTLGVAGAALGLVFGWAGVQGLLTLIPVPLSAWMRIEVDLPVLLFCMAAGVVTSLLFGLGPLLAARRLDLSSGLREGMRGTGRSPVRSTLVAAEIALSVMLLVGAGLLVQTFMRLQQRHPGFESGGLVASRVVMWVAGTRTESAPVLDSIHSRVLDALKALPGVRSAAVTNYLPYSSTSTERLQADIFIKGRAEQDTHTLASITGADVSPDYFSTMRIPLIRGRLFESTDTVESQPVIVISERAAQLFWPNQDPIGQEISWGKPSDKSNPWTRVVGIVGDVKHHAAEGDVGVEFYYPLAQWPVTTSYYVVRTDGAPETMLDTVHRTIVDAERTIAVTSVKTVERTMTESLWQRRMWGVLFTAFAVLALVLAALGIYGVISYAVAQRVREMGVRLAIGATPGEVRRLVVREGMTLCIIGAVCGAAAALALGQLASSLLFGVAAHDPVTYAVVLATIAVTGLAACWLPAVRASRVDPTTALRAE